MSDKIDFLNFIEDFKKVKALGFRESHRSHNTGIGKTYEDLLGIVENNFKQPDLHGFEIKSQRAYTGSYVTLFTKSPTMPVKANGFLKDNFGSYDEQYPNIKVLHTSVFANQYNSHKSGFRFMLQLNGDERKLYLIVADETDNIVSSNIYWTYDSLESCLCTKLRKLAYVSADTLIDDFGNEKFHFNKAIVFSELKGLDTFLQLIDEKIIMFDIRIGAYKTGTKAGMPHDHGSGFRIKREHMKKLYERYDVI